MARVSSEHKKQIRKSILKISKQHFLEKGFSKTKTKDIAMEVGIAEGTIFNYFPTKVDIFLEAMAEGYMTNFKAMEDINYQDSITEIFFDLFYSTLKPLANLPNKIIKDIAIAMIHLSKGKGETIKKVIELDYKLLKDIEEIIEKLIKQERLKPCDVKMTANVLYCVVVGEIIFYVYEDKIDKKQMLENVKRKISFTLEGHIL